MPEENSPKKIFNEIPKELLDLIEADDTALEVAKICLENKIEEDEKIKEIGYQTGRVLLGDLSPEKFPEVLVEKIKLSSFLARKISRGISKSIFDPVKKSLDALYKKETTSVEKPPVESLYEAMPEKEQEGPKKEDVYREPIE